MWYCIKIAKNKAKKVNKNNALVAQLDRVLYYELRCRFHMLFSDLLYNST